MSSLLVLLLTVNILRLRLLTIDNLGLRLLLVLLLTVNILRLRLLTIDNLGLRLLLVHLLSVNILGLRLLLDHLLLFLLILRLGLDFLVYKLSTISLSSLKS
jgi:hypothetical protein